MPFTYPPDWRPIRLGLTATPGGVQANGLPISYGINVLAVVAALGDSCLLPKSVGGGRACVIKNEGAAQAFVYPDSGSAINGIGVDGARGLSAGETQIYVDTRPGNWMSVRSS